MGLAFSQIGLSYKEITMKMKWLGGLLLIAAFTLPAFAQVSVYIEPRRPRFVRNAPVRHPDPASSGVEGY